MEKPIKLTIPASQKEIFGLRICRASSGAILCVCTTLVFFALGALSPAEAYVGCPDYPDGVIGTVEEGAVSFSNTSPECRQIGIAVYRLYSATVREGAFYYSNTTALQSGASRSFTVKPPLCSYVVDVIAGEPLKTIRSKADYGSRLLDERSFSAALGYCTPPGAGIPSGSSGPLPSPHNVPLPSPKTAAVPLPQPKVLGASLTPTSSSPLTQNTGSDVALPLALLASACISGIAFFAQRKFEK